MNCNIPALMQAAAAVLAASRSAASGAQQLLLLQALPQPGTSPDLHCWTMQLLCAVVYEVLLLQRYLQHLHETKQSW
jgi:hypothetical protein